MADSKDKVKAAAAAAAAVVTLHQQGPATNVKLTDQAAEIHAAQQERRPSNPPRGSEKEQHPPKK